MERTTTEDARQVQEPTSERLERRLVRVRNSVCRANESSGEATERRKEEGRKHDTSSPAFRSEKRHPCCQSEEGNRQPREQVWHAQR